MKLLFTLLLVAAFTSVSFGQILGSKHDFKADVNMNANSGTTDHCFTCHAPHNNSNDPATTGIDLLWNQTITAESFTMYPSGAATTINGTIDASVSGTSKLCLSCHDGVTLMGNGTTPAAMGAVDANVGSDLSNDHPIGITYEDGIISAVNTDAGLKLASTFTNVKLIGDKVECASCHDAHDDVGTNLFMLRTTNTSSALCYECHDK